MKNVAYAFCALAIALVIGGSLWASDLQPAAGLPTAEVVIEAAEGGQQAFTLEVAEKPVDIKMGLMFRTEMADNRGMIFLLGKPARPTSFWMKNTYIPLDMLFVDEAGVIAHIHRNAVPRDLTSIPSQKPVVAVIEINGGLADKRGIREGDKVRYSYFK